MGQFANNSANTEKLESTTKDEIGKKEKGEDHQTWGWGDVPELLLWMIIGRLNVLDGRNLGPVCRHWSSASASFPKTLNDDHPPWMLVQRNPYRNSRRLVSFWPNDNCSKQKKYFLRHPNLGGADVLYSNKGWLLLARYSPTPPGKDRIFAGEQPIILYNPLTNTTIKMPPLSNDAHPRWGSFSIQCTSANYKAPNYVVLGCYNLYFDYSNTMRVKLWIARPGDNNWCSYEYRTAPGNKFFLDHLIIVGKQVICVDRRGITLGFDLADKTWLDWMPMVDCIRDNLQNHIVEAGSEIIKVTTGESLVKFARLNETRTAWVELHYNSKEVQSKTWFLSKRKSFVVTGYPCRGIYLLQNLGTGTGTISLHKWDQGSCPKAFLKFINKEILARNRKAETCWVDFG